MSGILRIFYSLKDTLLTNNLPQNTDQLFKKKRRLIAFS